MRERCPTHPDAGPTGALRPPSRRPSTLLDRVEQRARFRHLRLVRATGHPLDENDRTITSGIVRPLGVAPRRWIEARDRGLTGPQFDAYWRALGEEIRAELFAEDPPRAA